MALANLPFDILAPIINFTLPNGWYKPEHRQWAFDMRLVCRKFNDIVSDSAFYKITFDYDLPERAPCMSDGIAVWFLARMAARNPESHIGIIKSMHLGAESIVGALTADGLQVDKQGGEYWRYLHAAAAAATLYQGRTYVMKCLVRPPYNARWTEGTGNSLAAAAISGNERVLRHLIENGADINARHKYFGVAICAAAFSERREIVKLLLDAGADGNMAGSPNEHGLRQSALTIAAAKRNVSLMQLLLDMGCHVEGQEILGEAPLSTAISKRHEEGIRLLMEHGADPTRKVWIYPPLDLAVMLGEEWIVRLLIPRIKTYEYSNLILRDALEKAVRRGQEGVVRLLTMAGTSVRPARLLLEAGADTEERNESNLTPLECAIARDDEVMAKLLRKAGANPNVTCVDWGDVVLDYNRWFRWVGPGGDETVD
ncbi:MAG: hypothetical protein M1839_002989 [Geoglossum umbratile]|nr:MAG: hypothetical protein M1839_002989 [Geoglossum umbratile]